CASRSPAHLPSSPRLTRRPPTSTLFPYTTLFRSHRHDRARAVLRQHVVRGPHQNLLAAEGIDGEQARVRALLLFLFAGEQIPVRSEEHTSELQSHLNLVCRLLLEKKKKSYTMYTN